MPRVYNYSHNSHNILIFQKWCNVYTKQSIKKLNSRLIIERLHPFFYFYLTLLLGLPPLFSFYNSLSSILQFFSVLVSSFFILPLAPHRLSFVLFIFVSSLLSFSSVVVFNSLYIPSLSLTLWTYYPRTCLLTSSPFPVLSSYPCLSLFLCFFLLRFSTFVFTILILNYISSSLFRYPSIVLFYIWYFDAFCYN